MAHFTALYDSCVLYPAPLRDLLMWLATTELYRARWTEAIHEEWMRSVLENRPDLSRERLERTRRLMDANVRDCLVTGYEDLIDALHLPDPNDRHVLAAAVRGRADVIVTYNLRDFPLNYVHGEFGISVQHPDEFVTHLLDLAPAAVYRAVKKQRMTLLNPPKSAEELLATFEEQQLVRTVIRLRRVVDLI